MLSANTQTKLAQTIFFMKRFLNKILFCYKVANVNHFPFQQKNNLAACNSWIGFRLLDNFAKNISIAGNKIELV